MDVGHIGQQMMLCATALGLGSCCLAAFRQKKCDEILQLDGEEEYTIFACPVGHEKNFVKNG
jgi:nitroreductase